MRQVAGLIPTYSSDEFGICSALYELGGMVVMHDASGCNSTYTTHDEPRWYDMDSMIFISAISEMEAIMGDDEKLIGDLVETAKELKPAFIAVVGAPIPYMIGTDLKAIAAITEAETGIPCIGFEANGMHDYTRGVSMALEAIVERFCDRNVMRQQYSEKSGKNTDRISINLIGATPLDFALNGSMDAIHDWAKDAGLEINCCMAMGSSLDKICNAGKADVNLILSSGGLKAAEKLEKIYGQPYIIGVPMGTLFAAELARQIREAAVNGVSRKAYELECMKVDTYTGLKEYSDEIYLSNVTTSDELLVIGEAVYGASIAAALSMETGRTIHVASPLELSERLLKKDDYFTPEEDDLLRVIRQVNGVIGDPFYKILCERVSPEISFYELPHEAFSGRIYDAVNPCLIGDGLMKYFRKRLEKC